MTMRRRSRVVRNPVRRTFASQSGTSAAPGSNMIDLTVVSEIAAISDSQVGDVLVTGIAGVDLVDEYAIHQMLLWVGRTSTQPSQQDRGVRTRQFPANEIGTPFILRIRGLRVDAGELMKLITVPTVETSTSIIHTNIVSVKWSYREMRQG